MRFRYAALWLIVGLLGASLLPARATHASPLANLTTIATSSAQFPRPLSDGTYLLWAEPGQDASPARLLAKEIASPAAAPFVVAELAQLSELDVAYGISNGVAAWSDFRDGSWNVYSRRLPDGLTFPIAATPGDEYFQATDGAQVIWTRKGDDGTHILSRSLATRQVTTIASVPSDYDVYYLRRVNAGIVWFEIKGITALVFTGKLRLAPTDGAPRTLVENLGWIFGADAAGDVVTYATNQNDFHIVAYNIATGAQRTLSAADAVGPVTNGRYVLWRDTSRSSPDVPTSDIYGYDLATNSRFPVVTDGRQIGYIALYPDQVLWSLTTADGAAIQRGPLSALLPSAPEPAPAESASVRFFPSTGHALADAFKEFWEQRGGLPVFGYPLTSAYSEINADLGQFLPTQYVERQRFEYHAEHVGTPYAVELGRLGVETLQQQGRDWQQLPKADPASPHYFAETGQAIDAHFWDYWRTHGLEFGDPDVSFREALALWGYPISPAQIETNPDGDTVLTQWFERARFEWHPDNPQEYRVLLGRLGAELLAARGW